MKPLHMQTVYMRKSIEELSIAASAQKVKKSTVNKSQCLMSFFGDSKIETGLGKV